MVTEIYLNLVPIDHFVKPHYESEAKCKVFVMKITFHLYANKTNFHMKSSIEFD